MSDNLTEQAIVTTKSSIEPSQGLTRIAFFNEDGTPFIFDSDPSSVAGTPRDSAQWTEDGEFYAGPFTPDQWSGFPDGAPTEGNWAAVVQFDDPTNPEMGFVRVLMLDEDPEAGYIPFYGANGTLRSGTPTQDLDVINKIFLDSLVSDRTGAAIADITIDDADDLESAISLANTTKDRFNELLDSLRSANIIGELS